MTSKSRLPYEEGDWFAVPLRNRGFGVGVVARSGPSGRVLFGYFFGPRREAVPAIDELRGYAAEQAVLVGQFGDLGLMNGTWRILGRQDPWERSAWPMPPMARVDVVSGQARKVTYSQDDPNQAISETPCGLEEARLLPRDSLMGAGAVEIRLTSLLSQEGSPSV
ncbi:MAG TPA: immunity 26/phosphotriesterase HocA family protein [Vicinamibacteria bacterium]|nr:immunity 26/phosphotriesterase HocA family protein [Vicinamibacteria bacterium]HRB11605.1 immunity 26/phosphotriesterase HocA family protein [Vicinamibacteria bacterium]